MSLVKTLGKLAVGALVAKGVGKVIQNKMGSPGGAAGRANPMNRGSAGGGMGGLLGGSSGSAGGMGELLGGPSPSAGGAGGNLGGLGGLLESLGGAAGGASGGSGAGAGGSAGAGSLGDLLNSVLRGGETPVEPSSSQNQQAEIMLKAMLNAAKCDGELDDSEKQKIMQNLDDISREDMAFIQRELAAPVDTDAFVRSVPRGMEQQVYLMSLMAIDLDSKPEADYLDALGKGLGISEQASNHIHQQLGVPTLYT